jgi:signal transduction protein with GAF and PtsI domain
MSVVFGENHCMSEDNENNVSERLRRLIETVDVANVLTEPLTRSIENLLQISAAEINSDEASVLIRDGDEGDLRFLCAIGKVAGQLLNMKVPAGKGIAGFVLSSGQPMVVSDVGEDQTFYAEVDKETGYSTQMILATPLRHSGEVIGVLEYINRRGEPPFESFSPAEMDKAALFADGIASLVNAYESAKLFRELGEKILTTEDDLGVAPLREWLGGLRDSVEHREMMDLAVLVRELSKRGDNERRLSRELLESILKYSDSKSDTSFLSF